MTGKKVFKIVYLILLAAVILFVDQAVVYVQESIDEFEASQPAHVVDGILEEFSQNVKAGKARDIMTYPDIELSPYENADVFAEYESRIASVSEWSRKILSGNYSEEQQIYGFYGDGELMARLVLNCTGSKILMEILTANSWQAGEIYPVVTLTTYTEYIDVPQGFTASLNGMEVAKDSPGVEWEEKDGRIIYSIPNLCEIKEAEVYDCFGCPCIALNENGYVTAEANYYNLILPREYTVFDGEHRLEGKTVAGGIQYEHCSASDSLLIKDKYGNEISYKNGDIVPSLDVSFVIPDNFEIEWQGNDMDSFIVQKEKIQMYEDYEEFAKMPELATYEIKGLLKLPEMNIKDNYGQKVEYTFNGNYFEIKEQTKLAELPEDVIRQADPMNLIKTWSLFLSNDLKGTRHGFGVLQPYLVPDTDFYIQAEKYSKGSDLNFASYHNDPEFIKEEISDLVMYGDNLFSCHVYLEKKMFILQTQMDKIDIINHTYFFYLHDGTWKIAGQWG